jgi:hypothetical protein
MYQFIHFNEEKAFFEIHKLFEEILGSEYPSHFIGDHRELQDGIYRSYCPYVDPIEKIRVLPFFFYGSYHIDLCISTDTYYIRGNVIANDLKIIGVFTNIHNISYNKNCQHLINKKDIKTLVDIMGHLREIA